MTIEQTRTETRALHAFTAEMVQADMTLPEKVDYVDHESFSRRETEQKLWGDGSEPIPVCPYRLEPETTENDLKNPKRRRLDRQEEELLFLRYNYAKYRVAEILNRKRVTRSARDKARTWWERAMHMRTKIVNANLPLVPAMARRIRGPAVAFDDLLSEGYMAVLRCVEKFDVSRGFKFSTYACRAILSSLRRLVAKTGKMLQRCSLGWDPKLERSDFTERRRHEQRESAIDSVRDVISENSAELTDVERTVVLERFGISSGGKKRTLAQVGQVVGLSNERVRQIEKKSLQKLRGALSEQQPIPAA